MIAEKIEKIYRERFNSSPQIYRSPGRVNIIGEHTDYNNGFVLPAAVSKSAWLAIGPAGGNKGNWISVDFNQETTIDFADIRKSSLGWPNYLLGVVEQFQAEGIKIPSFNAVIAADIPVGAGLSSSAALEAVCSFAINEWLCLGKNRKDLALLCQRAENQFIGLQCGIMDMFASLYGKKDHVIRLDCRSLDFEYFPLDLKEYQIVLLNTGVSHSLASSEYNIRREQCEEGVRVISRHYPDVKSLRDVDREMLTFCKKDMGELIWRRCKFVVQENDRVFLTCEYLKSGQLLKAGELMYASHEGLKHDYEVSCPELDFLVDQVRNRPGVAGARMMGGGFGGCTINLVEKKHTPQLLEEIGPLYQTHTGTALKHYEAVTDDGTSAYSPR